MRGAALVIHEGAEAGSEHPVDGELILGREHGSADLVIPDPGVSRRHARVLTENGALILEDLGSSNGTYVNGERISGPVELGSGDELQLGDTVIGVEAGTAATALMPPGSPPTEAHPGPTASRPARQPPPAGRPAPRRLAPPPHEPGNLPALAALFLGPLSILLLFLRARAASSSHSPAESPRSSSARSGSATSIAAAPPPTAARPASAGAPAGSARSSQSWP